MNPRQERSAISAKQPVSRARLTLCLSATAIFPKNPGPCDAPTMDDPIPAEATTTAKVAVPMTESLVINGGLRRMLSNNPYIELMEPAHKAMRAACASLSVSGLV